MKIFLKSADEDTNISVKSQDKNKEIFVKNEAIFRYGTTDFYVIGDGLKLEGNVLSVDTSNDVDDNNTKPITSAAVYETVGNIEVLLGTI